MIDIYESKDEKISLRLSTNPTAQDFNQIMRLRGCPIRVDSHETNTNAALLAAWDWLWVELRILEERTHG